MEYKTQKELADIGRAKYGRRDNSAYGRKDNGIEVIKQTGIGNFKISLQAQYQQKMYPSPKVVKTYHVETFLGEQIDSRFSKYWMTNKSEAEAFYAQVVNELRTKITGGK